MDTSTKPAVVLRQAAEASLHAAAANASKSGWKSSEFWVTVASAGLGVLSLVLVPTPFGALGAAGIAAAAGMYATSRGNVKKAALAAVGAAAAAASGAGGIVGEVGTAVAAVAGVTGGAATLPTPAK